MIHTIRVFRTGFFLAITLILVGTLSGLVYLNQVGFPGRYGEWIRKELGRKGIHLTFDSLRFEPGQGLVATGVSFFENEDQNIRLLEASRMILDLDKTKAIRGEFKLYGFKITEGSARIPVPAQRRYLEARQINGTLEITSKNRALLRDATGIIDGIQLNFSADLKLPQKSESRADPARSDQFIRTVLDEFSRWQIPTSSPPTLVFHVEGDLNRPDRLRTTFQFEAYDLIRNDYQLKAISLSGDLRFGLITLDQIRLVDDTGVVSGRADWNLRDRDGRFDLTSTFQPQRFLLDCFGVEILPDLALHSPPSLSLQGDYSQPPEGSLSFSGTGQVELGPFTYRGTRFDRFTSDLSWHDRDLFLRDLHLHRMGKLLQGNLILEGEGARFDLKSNFPLEAFQPLIKPDGGLDRALSQLVFRENSGMHLDLVGSFNRGDPKIWSADGTAHLTDFSYKGTRIHHLTTDYQLSREEARFSDLKALLNDQKEKARLRYRGDASGELLADRILFDSRSKFVTISNLRGKLWPTPIIRIFAPKTADHLEENYRFHEPPQLTLNGRFAGRREDYPQSVFSVAIRTEGRTDYPFLGSDLPLQDLQADVVVKGHDLTIKNLSASALEGTVSGSVFCRVNPGAKATYRGSLKWDDLSFRRLSKVYQFEDEEKGTLTGSIDFEGTAGNVRNFNADGIIAIKRGNLVSLPVLGPLSPLIAGLLGDKRMGYERAKDASARFAVRKGILQTKDFVAISTSITLTGEGWIDLLTKKMDMVIRINARGLLGFLTLPLQPLKGIFQFRASGTYDRPQWRSSPFTRPAKGEKDPIFRPPGRARIVPE